MSVPAVTVSCSVPVARGFVRGAGVGPVSVRGAVPFLGSGTGGDGSWVWGGKGAGWSPACARAAFSLARTALQRARVPVMKTVRTSRIISWLMRRPQKRP
jgi:hypothetical protein